MKDKNVDSILNYLTWAAVGVIVLFFGWLMTVLNGPPRHSCYLGSFESSGDTASPIVYSQGDIDEQLRLLDEQKEKGTLSDQAYERIKNSIVN